MTKKNFFSICCLLLMQGCHGQEHSKNSSADNNSRNNGCIIRQVSDLTKQMPCLEKNAEAGSAIDQYNLAIAYRDGWDNGSSDPNKAFYWMEKAAENNRTDAQVNLGLMYLNGIGVEYNRDKALYWYKKALSNGEAAAYNNIGFLYERTAPINLKKACENYQKGFEVNSMTAKGNLGRCYFYGIDRQVNISKGMELLNDAAENGVAFAQDEMIQVYLEGKEHIPQDKTKAFILATKYAESGNPGSLYNLGVMYEQGLGTEVNHQKSAEYFRKASEQNNIPAKYNLALMLWEGKYIDKNQEEAIALLKTAAENNCTKAMDSLVRVFLPETEVHRFWKKRRQEIQEFQDACPN